MPPEIREGQGEEQSYVVAGATISCNYGSKRTALKTPFSHGVYIGQKAQLNIMDFKPTMNIMPFGRCASLQNPTVAAATAANNGVLQPMPCTPMITMPWINGKEDKLVDQFPALLNKSTNSCLYCGIIQIEEDGQEPGSTTVEEEPFPDMTPVLAAVGASASSAGTREANHQIAQAKSNWKKANEAGNLADRNEAEKLAVDARTAGGTISLGVDLEDARRMVGNEMILAAKELWAKAGNDPVARKHAEDMAAEGRRMGGTISSEDDLEVARRIVANERILAAKQRWQEAFKAGDKAGMDAAARDAEEARKMGGTISSDDDLEEAQRTVANQLILSAKEEWSRIHADPNLSETEKRSKKTSVEEWSKKGRELGGTITLEDNLEDARRMVANEIIWKSKQNWQRADELGREDLKKVAADAAAYARKYMGGTITNDHSIEEAARIVYHERSHAPSLYDNAQGRPWNGIYDRDEWEKEAQALYVQTQQPGGNGKANNKLWLVEQVLYAPNKEDAAKAKAELDREKEREKISQVVKNQTGRIAKDSGPRAGGNPSYSDIINYVSAKCAEIGLPEDIGLAIVWTESRMQQYFDNGDIYKGENRNEEGIVTSTDWGIMQINDKSWGSVHNFDKIKSDWKYGVDCGLSVALDRYKKAVQLGEENIARATYSGYNTWSNLSRYRTTNDSRDTHFWDFYNKKPWEQHVEYYPSGPNSQSNNAESQVDNVASKQRKEVVDFAIQFVGKIPYCLDTKISTIDNLDPNNPPAYMDCSDFTSSVYKTLFGKNIGAHTGVQINSGEEKNLKEILPGDLILFDWPDNRGLRSGKPDHVGIYIGNGQFIHETGTNQDPSKLDDPKQNVKIDSLDTNWGKPYGLLKDNVISVRRIIPETGL
jgi:cell wall-associated NlpC family hydrolase